MHRAIDSIVHNLLLEVHKEEKLARMQTAVVEVEIRAEKLGKNLSGATGSGDHVADTEPVETKAAQATPGNIQLKGNPMKTVKHIRCPNCRLQRLLYPRVGFNARPPPDPSAQYCKQEPMIILDRHDVHGQRKKGVKVKGQAKGKNKKKNEGASPVSNNSDPLTPSSSMPDSFEFREIDYPAAKCPNRNSHLGDHWKAVNLFATHLNGSCWLRRDRAAMREANAKINSTPKDSRANSPKPGPQTNGVKRKADDKEESTVKKKQKTGDNKKSASGGGNTKKTVPGQPSKLREESHADDDGSPIKAEAGDTIQVAPKIREQSVESAAGKLKLSSPGGPARKKLNKGGKK